MTGGGGGGGRKGGAEMSVYLMESVTSPCAHAEDNSLDFLHQLPERVSVCLVIIFGVSPVDLQLAVLRSECLNDAGLCGRRHRAISSQPNWEKLMGIPHCVAISKR